MRSIRSYLFALVAICVIVAAVAFGLIVAQTNQANRRQLESQTQETAGALSQSVDRELERALGVLAALSESEAAHMNDWPSLDRQARAALRDKSAWIVVHDRSGRQLVNTRLPPGADLPRGNPLPQMWTEIANGRPRICDLSRGIVEPNIVCVDAPIGRGPRHSYAISMIFQPSAFDPIITRTDIGSGKIASLVDRSSRIIWRNVRPNEFVGRAATGEMRRKLSTGANSGILESTSLEGVRMLSAFHRSPLSGWSVIVGTPLAEIETSSRMALWRGSLLALALLGLGAGLALLLGARLVSAINDLVTESEPQNSPSPPKRTGIAEIDAVADALRASFAARQESERHQQMLVGELNHRVKNTLSIVQSLAHQTFRGNASPKDANAAFESRLAALAGAHNLLIKTSWESASIREVVRTALSPFCNPSCCLLEGPDLNILPQTAVSLSLAMHELATNASKYGALSQDGGRINVSWIAENSTFTLLWREIGGPPVKPPSSTGFGLRLIKRALAAELGGAAEVAFEPDGLTCKLVGRLAA